MAASALDRYTDPLRFRQCTSAEAIPTNQRGPHWVVCTVVERYGPYWTGAEARLAANRLRRATRLVTEWTP